MKVGNRTRAGWLSRDEIEVLVVAFYPVQRRARFRIFTRIVGQVARTQPEHHLRMARHDAIECVERTMQIPNGTEVHNLVNLRARELKNYCKSALFLVP